MEYYLETNSLRQLISKINTPFIEKNAYTSILALMEIASGIMDEQSFTIRKNVIEKTLSSKLIICIAFPETLFLNAFGCNKDDKELTSGVRRVFQLIIDSQSYSDFTKKIEASSSKEYYDFIITYDKNGSAFFQNAFLENIDQVRKKYGFKNLIEAFNSRWSSNDEKFGTDLYSTMIKHFAKGVFKNNKTDLESKDPRSLEEIEKSYDHSVDTFIVMSTVYSDKHISFGNKPGINDCFDLSHLIYLDRIGKIIVTDDKLFHKTLTGSFSKMTISTQEFKNINCL